MSSAAASIVTDPSSPTIRSPPSVRVDFDHRRLHTRRHLASVGCCGRTCLKDRWLRWASSHGHPSTHRDATAGGRGPCDLTTRRGVAPHEHGCGTRIHRPSRACRDDDLAPRRGRDHPRRRDTRSRTSRRRPSRPCARFPRRPGAPAGSGPSTRLLLDHNPRPRDRPWEITRRVNSRCRPTPAPARWEPPRSVPGHAATLGRSAWHVRTCRCVSCTSTRRSARTEGGS
jgi:hypothetical protein